MDVIRERVKRVVAQRVTDAAIERLAGEDLSRLDRAREKEKQAQMNALARAATSNSASKQPSGDRSSASEPRVLEDMMEEEDCPVCTSILAAVSEMAEPRRTRGVAEYGEFRLAVEESEEMAKQVLEDSEVLIDALDNVSAAPEGMR
jgi:hypothetical protein